MYVYIADYLYDPVHKSTVTLFLFYHLLSALALSGVVLVLSEHLKDCEYFVRFHNSFVSLIRMCI